MANRARMILAAATPLKEDTPCSYCRLPLGETGLGKMAFEVDHIIPKSLAPQLKYVVSNLVWACRRCNHEKGSHVKGCDEQSGKMRPLFNPRSERWSDHFKGTKDGKIHGQSGTGRATAKRLAFNSEPSVLRRRERGYRESWWPA